VFCTGTSIADPAVDADAPPAIAKDTPAIPKAGAALFPLFRFELFLARAIGALPYLIVGVVKPAVSTVRASFSRYLTDALVRRKKLSAREVVLK
jgi:hypothetical protein